MTDDMDIWETTGRIETLVDGIFAIAMTLLVLNLSIPQLTSSVPNITIENYLISSIPKFFTYGLSFVILAIFWRVNHQQFYRIKRADSTFLWITVLWLLFVALVPFSTSLMGGYGETQSANIFFNINLLLIGIFSGLIWYYATKKDFIEELSREKITELNKLNLMLPIAALIAIGVSFVIPAFSTFMYLTIPIIKRIIKA
ncbi:TMEM175 family protein [Methanobacterium sp.]|uniref:TMEM175 family protein n=1 Tax=Methanobacterium sp. TaxID=2164 RepID=UPI003C78FFCC